MKILRSQRSLAVVAGMRIADDRAESTKSNVEKTHTKKRALITLLLSPLGVLLKTIWS